MFALQNRPPSDDNNPVPLTLSDIQREIAALPPTLSVEGVEAAEANAPAGNAALQIVARQGRLILKLSAAAESLEARYHALAEQTQAQNERVNALSEEARQAQKRTRQVSLEAIRLMDALDWVGEALEARGQDALLSPLRSAQRDCLRRLASAGITEIPCAGQLDGHLHEAVGTGKAADEDTPRYHIVSVVQRGYQCGPDILRRAKVVTAA